jgi:ubiquinone/menaquinone biosynthesis C-methylase UbiE
LADANPAADFDEIAGSYDRLRPMDAGWWEVFEALVRAGDLIGRRTLDAGCGTGTLAAALAERGGKVWGIDRSPEMLEQARARHASPRFKEASAESLPFKDAWFERAVMRLSLHLLDRQQALAEAARVLVAGGRIAVATFDPAHFGRYWLTEFFPSIEAIDRARFPDAATLAAELQAAGFEDVQIEPLSQVGSIGRAEALERIRGRYISTLRLLDAEEYERGLDQAERGLSERIDYRMEWLIAVATKPGLDAVRMRG